MEDSPAASHLVVFEDRAEMDCVIKYLLDEFPDQTDTRWADDVKAPVTVMLTSAMLSASGPPRSTPVCTSGGWGVEPGRPHPPSPTGPPPPPCQTSGGHILMKLEELYGET